MRWALPRVAGGVAAVLTLQLLTAGMLEAQTTTGIVRGRVVEQGTNRPVGDAQVLITGTSLRALSNAAGEFSITNVTPGTRSITARRIGFSPATQTVLVAAGQTATVTLTMGQSASQLDAVVVTALGETTERRTLGTSQQTVQGEAIAETQRENFVNALQGRVAGVEVTSSSGVPGASSSITIRGVSSISGSNQPLMIIDGLPMDNKTLNTSVPRAAPVVDGLRQSRRRLHEPRGRPQPRGHRDDRRCSRARRRRRSTASTPPTARSSSRPSVARSASGGFEYSNSFRDREHRVRAPGAPARLRPERPSAAATFLYFGRAVRRRARSSTTTSTASSRPRCRSGTTSSSAAPPPDNTVNYRVPAALTQPERRGTELELQPHQRDRRRRRRR